jgi:accessory colonization factor AcfC
MTLLPDIRELLIPGIRENIKFSVLTVEEGADKWLSSPSPDAWITYESWHVKLKGHSEFIRLSGKDALERWTPIAVTTITPQRDTGTSFIAFLKSEEGRKIFARWGWQ